MSNKLDMSTAAKLRRVAINMRNGITMEPYQLLDVAAAELERLAGEVERKTRLLDIYIEWADTPVVGGWHPCQNVFNGEQVGWIPIPLAECPDCKEIFNE